jgi:hypothetical protein
MATSPIYGWAEPDNTDLVKNGALAIRTLGNAIDTTMGTMTPKSTVTAKGSLIAATAASTPANLSAGNNGEALYADSSASTGLRYVATPSASNPILNSAFQVAQRGTTFSSIGGSTYTLDRWQNFRGAGQVYNVSQQTTSDNTNLPFILYCARVGRPVSNTSTQAVYFVQSLETINSRAFAGKVVTFSFYARKGADYSAASNLLALELTTGTGTDQNMISGYTGAASPISSTATLTTTWQRFTYTSSTLSSSATQLGINFNYTPVGTAGAADYYEITGVQVDIGNVALPFRTAGVSYAQELAMCQRYYETTLGGVTSVTNMVGGTVMGADTGSAIYRALYIPYKVTKRGTPTVTIYDGVATAGKISSVSSATLSPTNGITGTADNIGLDNYRVYWLTTNGGANWNHVVSAEL